MLPQINQAAASSTAATTHDPKEVTMKSGILNLETIAQAFNPNASWGVAIAKKAVATVVLVLAMLSLSIAQVPECTAGKLSDYEKLGAGGCTIGDKTFSNFFYHRVLNGLPSSAISVTPGTVPETEDAGILLEAKWAAPTSQESFVTYTIAVQPNGKPIKGATLEMQLGEITGTGEATVMAALCSPAGSSDGCREEQLDLKVVLSSGQSNKAVDEGNFKNPLTAVRVTTPVELAPGRDGTATLDSFMTVFSQ
jgi:hypothetical protein